MQLSRRWFYADSASCSNNSDCSNLNLMIGLIFSCFAFVLVALIVLYQFNKCRKAVRLSRGAHVRSGSVPLRLRSSMEYDDAKGFVAKPPPAYVVDAPPPPGCV